MHARRSHSRGLTLLEMMIVIAIIGLGMLAMRTGWRAATKADLAEDSNDLAAYLRRASQLAIEHGEVHRVVLDFDSGVYIAEVCQGAATIARNEQLRAGEDDKTKDQLERAKERVKDMASQVGSGAAPSSAEDEMRIATAIAGHHVADRTCAPVTAGPSLDQRRPAGEWQRRLKVTRDIKFREVWVQHMEQSTRAGQVAVYFFPNGSSEKAVIQLTDGDSVRSILVHGLTGMIQEKSTMTNDDVDAHMLRNILNEREKPREGER